MAKRAGPPRKARNPKKISEKPWEPTPLQLKWYIEWTENFKGPSQIARENTYKVSRAVVCKILHKIDEYYRLMFHDQVMAVRGAQTRQHEVIMQESFEAWKKSVGKVTVVTETVGGDDDTLQTKTSISHGDTSYLSTAMTAAKAIREIWGVNAPIKTDTTIHNAEEIPELPDGMGLGTRSEALLNAAKAIQELGLRQAAREKADK